MKRLAFLVFALWFVAAAHAASALEHEPPELLQRVEAGELPPMDERLPETPRVVDFDAGGLSLGVHGGTMRTLTGRPEDVRQLVVFGYARLVGYNREFELVPDIVERVEVEGGKTFTFHLREGHRWSDGQPFTSEDFRYRWEDVLNNLELAPGGLPRFLLVNGRGPYFEVVDETTVRYSWDKPNRYFLAALAGARPEYLYQPSHYLKAFHKRYAKPDDLAARIKADGVRNWVALHTAKGRQYRNTNPDLPSLQPWVVTASDDPRRFVFVRNPYYHRVDPEGRQLPYVDRVEMTVVDPERIPILATIGGMADLQARGLGFEHFAMLKLAEAHGEFDVRLWVTGAGSALALYPNQNAADPEWRELLREADFRRALSLGIDRSAINQFVFYGLGVEAANTVLRESSLFRPGFEEAWAVYNPEVANRLLDDLGLRRGGDGLRRLPDDRPLRLEIATGGENPTDLEVLRIVADGWAALGIELAVTALPRRDLRRSVLDGETLLSAWKGLENGVPGPDTAPLELVPSRTVQLHWPAWGRFVETGGFRGLPIDTPDVARLVFLSKAWETAANRDERRLAWQTMLAWHAENVFTIGTVHAVPQPVLVSRRLRNVPLEGIYNWEPGAYFGVYQPDTFWFEGAAEQ